MFDSINVRLIPFGNTYKDHKTDVYLCKNGEKECKLELYESCAIKEYGLKVSFPFIKCIQHHLNDLDDYLAVCSYRHFLNPNDIILCTGNQKLIFKEMEEASKETFPFQFVNLPLVFVNNNMIENPSKQLFFSLCKEFEEEKKPKFCQYYPHKNLTEVATPRQIDSLNIQRSTVERESDGPIFTGIVESQFKTPVRLYISSQSIEASMHIETLLMRVMAYPQVISNKPHLCSIAPWFDVSVIVWGSTHVQEDASLACDGGQNECYGNIVLTCVIHHLKNPIDYLPVINCLMQYHNQMSSHIMPCVGTTINKYQLANCVNTDKGKNLLVKNGEVSMSAFPYGIPASPTLTIGDYTCTGLCPEFYDTIYRQGLLKVELWRKKEMEIHHDKFKGKRLRRSDEFPRICKDIDLLEENREEEEEEHAKNNSDHHNTAISEEEAKLKQHELEEQQEILAMQEEEEKKLHSNPFSLTFNPSFAQYKSPLSLSSPLLPLSSSIPIPSIDEKTTYSFSSSISIYILFDITDPTTLSFLTPIYIYSLYEQQYQYTLHPLPILSLSLSSSNQIQCAYNDLEHCNQAKLYICGASKIHNAYNILLYYSCLSKIESKDNYSKVIECLTQIINIVVTRDELSTCALSNQMVSFVQKMIQEKNLHFSDGTQSPSLGVHHQEFPAVFSTFISILQTYAHALLPYIAGGPLRIPGKSSKCVFCVDPGMLSSLAAVQVQNIDIYIDFECPQTIPFITKKIKYIMDREKSEAYNIFLHPTGHVFLDNRLQPLCTAKEKHVCERNNILVCINNLFDDNIVRWTLMSYFLYINDSTIYLFNRYGEYGPSYVELCSDAARVNYFDFHECISKQSFAYLRNDLFTLKNKNLRVTSSPFVLLNNKYIPQTKSFFYTLCYDLTNPPKWCHHIHPMLLEQDQCPLPALS
ncbi:hypothetical protein WA158_002068 [Blastocystis sp. Blastoise]